MRRSAVEVAQELLSHAEGGEDPWLISYADLVTNLLAFMVLLVSIAGISFRSVEDLPSMFSSDRSRPPLQELERDIAELAQAEGLGQQVGATVDAEGLAIRLEDQILFPSGVATLTSEGRRLVVRVADLLERVPPRFKVRVEGHTDDVPISNAQYPSNWELSAARAIEVRRALTDDGEGALDGARVAIAAYADTRPPAADADGPSVEIEERRRRARRVVIRVHY